MEENKSSISLSQAVEAIKTAILQGQYEAAKDVNRVQLAVYYAVGKYLSKNAKRFAWGSAVMEKISEQLHKELPGLRGFSTSNLYEIRKFYEAWKMLDTDIPVVTGKCINTTDNILKPTDIKNNSNFPVVTGKFSSQEISITLPDMDDLKQLLENDNDYKIVKE